MNMKRLGSILLVILIIILLLFVVFGIVADLKELSVLAGIPAACFFLLYIRLRKSAKAEKQHVAEVGKEAYRQEKKNDRIIDYVVIAGSESKTSTSSAITRGAVGGALLGPVGMLAAAGAKKNSFVELVVRYKSGRTETVKVKFDSKEFKNYAKYIR